MAFLPPIELPDLTDLCPPWLDTIFRRYENSVDEETALAAAEAELTHRVSIFFFDIIYEFLQIFEFPPKFEYR